MVRRKRQSVLRVKSFLHFLYFFVHSPLELVQKKAGVPTRNLKQSISQYYKLLLFHPVHLVKSSEIVPIENI